MLFFPLLGVLPYCASIHKAGLELCVTSVRAPQDEASIGVYRVTEPWQERRVTWKVRPEYDPRPVGCLPLRPAGPADRRETKGRVSVDVTAVVCAWLSGEAVNAGLLLKPADPESTRISLGFSGCKDPCSDKWPRLRVGLGPTEAGTGQIPGQAALLASALAGVMARGRDRSGRFTEDHQTLQLPRGGSLQQKHDNSEFTVLTVVATNLGPGAVRATLAMSADGEHVVEEAPPVAIPEGETRALVPMIFGRYSVLDLEDSGGRGATVEVWYQGQRI